MTSFKVGDLVEFKPVEEIGDPNQGLRIEQHGPGPHEVIGAGGDGFVKIEMTSGRATEVWAYRLCKVEPLADWEVELLSDPINLPDHYRWHPSGVECREIAEAFPFNLGSALKYIWRSAHKGKQIEDLRKAANCIQAEIERLERGVPERETSAPSMMAN